MWRSQRYIYIYIYQESLWLASGNFSDPQVMKGG